MPFSKLSPNDYFSIDRFSRENAVLFKENWIFTGLVFPLKGRKHYGLSLGNIEILLQLDGYGKPRAFLNVCSHRQAQLCEPGLHEGPIRCPYHSWVYDQRGVPTGIPSKKCFPEVVANPENYQLTEFHCETVGQFIFVRISSTGPDLRTYLGNEYSFLERISHGMQGLLDEFIGDVDANWKILIENSLEGYHVPSVHSRTFGSVAGMSDEALAPEFYLDDPLHTYLEHAADNEWLKRFSRTEQKIGKWPHRFEYYTHHFIFPNLTVTSFMGYSYHIQYFNPLSPLKTRVHSRTVGVDISDSTIFGKKLIDQIHSDSNKFTRKVFNEDAEICQKVQMGVNNAIRSAILGVEIEDRISHFQSAYMRKI
ncbi:aromatic ring-hydroxylating dioxygenase subunit alpha [Comamonas sp.]|uniref:aromatic ring-hydroxylating oxygenase subunit alpha n=1 Tax=Comamonas sp. TaxID=34028 RepID=UPI00289884A7|nr:aromatic ring-hydroxylating dioxygenase subunit alpha [Comamonas sp.]